jgi:hypothetical protein
MYAARLTRVPSNAGLLLGWLRLAPRVESAPPPQQPQHRRSPPSQTAKVTQPGSPDAGDPALRTEPWDRAKKHLTPFCRRLTRSVSGAFKKCICSCSLRPAVSANACGSAVRDCSSLTPGSLWSPWGTFRRAASSRKQTQDPSTSLRMARHSEDTASGSRILIEVPTSGKFRPQVSRPSVPYYPFVVPLTAPFLLVK